MSVQCPLYGRIVLYLDCLECENRKECKRKNMYEKYSGKIHCCGTCTYHKAREQKMQTGQKSGIVNQIKGTEITFRCANPSSEYYAFDTEYNFNCMDYEEKSE